LQAAPELFLPVDRAVSVMNKKFPAKTDAHCAHRILRNARSATAMHPDSGFMNLPRPNSRWWKLLVAIIDSPIVRALVAALAVYCVWTGAFPEIARTLGGATGLPPLICGGLLQGAIAGHLVTGDIRGIAFGALSGMAFGTIGDLTSGWIGIGKWMGRSALQAFAGGTLCALQGGSFLNGFAGSLCGGLAPAADLPGILGFIGKR